MNAALKEFIRRKHVKVWVDSWGKIIVDDTREESRLAAKRREDYLESLRRGEAAR